MEEYTREKPPTPEQCNDMRDKWAKQNGLKLSKSYRSNLTFLVGDKKAKTVGLRNPYELHFELGFDHVTCWNKDGKPYCVVAQPYVLKSEHLSKIIHIAELLGLEFDISANPSWHYPHGVITVIWKHKKS